MLRQNSKTRSLQNDKYSKGSGSALVAEGGGGGWVVERFSESEGHREGVHRSARDIFLFHFFFSLFFNCFTPFYAFFPDHGA